MVKQSVLSSRLTALSKLSDTRFKHQEEMVRVALSAAKEAVTKAEVATEKRFESVNEFRQTLSDQTSSFIPRAEFLAMHKAMEDKIEDLRSLNNTMVNKTSFSSGRDWAFGAAIATAITIANIAVHVFMKSPTQ